MQKCCRQKDEQPAPNQSLKRSHGFFSCPHELPDSKPPGGRKSTGTEGVFFMDKGRPGGIEDQIVEAAA
jgi:hypothetical protein